MDRARCRSWCIGLLVCLALGLSIGPAAARMTPDQRAQMLPIRYTPIPAEGTTGAVWDSLIEYEEQGRWRSADSTAGALVGALESDPEVDSLDLARALFHVANARLFFREYSDGRAVNSLRRAMDLRARGRGVKPTDPFLVWGHTKAATFYTEAGSPDSARSHGEVAVQLLESQSPTDTSMLAQAHLGLATALLALSEDDAAGPHFEAALYLRERADKGPKAQLVPMLAEYGTYLARAGEIDRARAHLQRAVRISEGMTPLNDFLVTSLGRLSSFENRVGNCAESLDLARRAYALSRGRGEQSVYVLRTRTVVAYRLQELGDAAGSAILLKEIVPGFEAGLGPNHPQTVNARMSYIASLLDIGDTATAARELEAARPVVATQDRRTNSNWVYWQQLMSSLHAMRGEHSAARDSLWLAIESEQLRHDPFGARGIGLVGDLLDNVRSPADAPQYARAVPLIDRLRDSTLATVSSEWQTTLHSRAAAEARLGLRDSAWAHALEAERLMRERLGYQLEALSDLRGLQLASTVGGSSELVVGLARPTVADEVETAWDRVVRRRGLVGHEIARRRAPRAAASDTALATSYARWIAAQRRLAQLVVSGAAHGGDPESAARLAAARSAADRAEASYVRAARGAVAPDSAVTLERVRERIGRDQALVAFALANDGSSAQSIGAFVARGGEAEVQWLPLGPVATVDADIRAWVDALGGPPLDASAAAREERRSRELGAAVRKRVWDPIAQVVGSAREILVVPEGAVNELPWHALPLARGRYLAESPLSIRVVWSERDLVPSTDEPSAARGLLAVGDPAFDRAPEGASEVVALAAVQDERPGAAALRAPPSPCVGAGGWQLAALPAARAETDEVARRFADGETRVLVGESADEASFKREAPGREVIHLATHGVMVQDTCRAAGALDTRGVGGLDPLAAKKPAAGAKPKSAKTAGGATGATPGAAASARNESPWLERQVWLAFVGANRPFGSAPDENEGLLTAEEVVTLDLRGTDWVVLSACHSGSAVAWAREGVLGMRRAFHLAGAGSVIASRWAVADEPTREWMNALYDARARGARAAAAAGQASRVVLERRRAEKRPTHPFYWAAFSSIGD